MALPLDRSLVVSAASDGQLAEMLGLPLFSTDWFVPAYQLGETEHWRIVAGAFHIEHGYSSGAWAVQAMPILLRRVPDASQRWETWMSLSPKEIESQELACLHATGHVVVMGLGMAWVAINMAFNPAVSRVTIIERDPEVIALLTESRALEGVPAAVRAKLHIELGDALTWLPDAAMPPVDFLYADIWQSLDEPDMLADVQQMQRNVQASRVYFWGQELVLYRLVAEDDWKRLPFAALRACIQALTGLPVLMADARYVQMVLRVMANFKARQVP